MLNLTAEREKQLKIFKLKKIQKLDIAHERDTGRGTTQYDYKYGG